MDRYYVEVIWRYAEGHRQTAIHQLTVKSTSPEAAEAWGEESLRRKFGPEKVEIIKSTARFAD